MKFRKKPCLIAWLGILTDYLTTRIALGHAGFYETHPNYSPLYALAIFTCSILLLDQLLPKTPRWNMALTLWSILSWLGTINNILALTGIINGLIL